MFKSGVICWQCHKQMIVALFTTKNEYMVIVFDLKKVVNWLKQLVKEIITIVNTWRKVIIEEYILNSSFGWKIGIYFLFHFDFGR